MTNYDVLIVGGGAAGFFSAINTAQKNPALKIAILERGNTVLSKVKISGVEGVMLRMLSLSLSR